MLLAPAEQSSPTELAVTSTKSYQDPFNEEDLDVIFVNQGKRQWRVPAYWADGNTWKVRFAPPRNPGTAEYPRRSYEPIGPHKIIRNTFQSV
jgi:hypothetical protein